MEYSIFTDQVFLPMAIFQNNHMTSDHYTFNSTFQE